MIATGGTIASKNSERGLSPAITAEELLGYVPEIADKCEVETVSPFNLDSTNVYYRHWLELAALIERNYADYDGFVVTHGTDTMAYTAAALSYLVQNSAKPVVLTGSQKSVCLRDTDARKNLSDAFSYCADDGAFGVRVVFDGKIILGTRAKKTRTRSYNAFSSVDFPEVGVVRDGTPVYYLNDNKPTGAPVFGKSLDPDVFVLKMIPGMSAQIFEYLGEHYDGVIVESFGSGGLPRYENDAFFSFVKAFVEKGKTLVLGTQVEREGSALDVYEVGKRFLSFPNVLEARNMTLEATVAKLMWILGKTRDEAEIGRLFLTPVDRDVV
ncbi:MAG: asparaginase [Candidatus Gallimonas sp.]